MARIIGITNQKGGVGKSSTAMAFGFALSFTKKRGLFIDLDPQGNLSHTLKVKTDKASIYEVLAGELPIVEAIQHTGKIDIIAASPRLSGADKSLDKIGKEYLLKEVIQTISKDYAFIVIDTPPTLGILMINALTACNDIIIPSHADIYSLQGIGQLYQTIETVQKYCNPELKIAGILLTRFNPRIVLNRSLSLVLEKTARELHTKLFATRIRECIAVKEAQAAQTDLFTYDSHSNAAKDYLDCVREYLEGLDG
jgi:chromosome partitioning protein